MIPFTVLSRKIWIWHQGKRVLVHPVENFPRTLLVAAGTGDIYEQYWREGDTRADPKKRCFRCYPDVWSAYRGLRQAQASATIRRLPLLQELHGECAASFGLLTGPAPSAPKTLTEVGAFALDFLERVVQPQTHALREAREQIERVAVLRDALGRRNPYALAARLTQVRERLIPERIKDIIGWLGHYLHREHDLNLLLQLAGGFLPPLNRQITTWIAQLSDLAISADTMLAISRQIKPPANLVASLTPFGGWSNWARACATDFRLLSSALVGAKREPATTALGRLRQSLAIKQVQSAISDLLLDIKLDEISGSLQVPSYRSRLDALQRRTSGLNDGNLRRPVAAKLVAQFQAARDALTAKPFDGKQIKLCRDHLRGACNAL